MTTLTPRAGFDPQLINWGGPDELRTRQCSYCDAPFPADEEDSGFVPLALYRADGWVAEFCDDCQAKWWGLRKVSLEDDGEGFP